MSNTAINRRSEKQKIGHRRVDDDGQVTYKKRPTNEIMLAIQLGIQNSVGNETQRPYRDLLTQDFGVLEIVDFPSFTFKTYAPMAFRHFRKLYNIDISQFLASICGEELEELSNPGASGSIFYRTADDNFIIKTVQHKEAKYLQRLLLQYYLTLTQNPRTLLPKFYGLYCYQCGSKNIRFVVMNNLLPSSIRLSEKYDLKGSTYKRRAGSSEREKSVPTFKDLDFKLLHENGLFLEADMYNSLMECISRDCLVLESFRIMDYSLLLGIYNLDQAIRDREASGLLSGRHTAAAAASSSQDPVSFEMETAAAAGGSTSAGVENRTSGQVGLQRGLSVKRISLFNTPIESINAERARDPVDMQLDEEALFTSGGIPAKNSHGDRLFLFTGIIDILQSYRLFKKMEHAMKSIITDGDTVSVHNPRFYSDRFQLFLKTEVFKKQPDASEPQESLSQSLLPPRQSSFKFRRTASLATAKPAAQARKKIRTRASTMEAADRPSSELIDGLLASAEIQSPVDGDSAERRNSHQHQQMELRDLNQDKGRRERTEPPRQQSPEREISAETNASQLPPIFIKKPPLSDRISDARVFLSLAWCQRQK
uniref:PIPK domain-containing protein n=1 Tax=Macrostomum lignano TaxID=282301 RepID=A0A1I8HSF4_9PLAT